MFGEILERFIKDSPVAVMVRILPENLLNADKMDRWFDQVRQSQYTKEVIVHVPLPLTSLRRGGMGH